MADAMNRPTTVEEAFQRGLEAHHEGMNPFRNMGVEHYKLNNAWMDGFQSREVESED